VYPLSVAQFAVDPYADIAAVNDEELTEADKQEIIDSVMDHLVSLAVIENKLMETGHHDFTPDETDILRAAAASQYESTWQTLYRQAQDSGSDVTEAEITAWMDEAGYTQEAFLREIKAREWENRILDLYCSDVTVTEEEAEEYYRETFLEPDRAKYADNVPQYEQDALAGGIQVFYTPEGYRYIKNILLAFPEEIETGMAAIRAKGKKQTAAVQKAYEKLAAAAAAGEDITPLKEKYDQKTAALQEQEERCLAKAREAIPLLQETIDTIREKLASGISIETLLQEYSLDQQQTGTDKPGALYHPSSALWPEEAKDVLNAMKTPGELSRPYADEQGVHLFFYAGDAPGGERILTAEEENQLRESALYAAQTEKLSGLVEEWKKDYEITVDASMIYFDCSINGRSGLVNPTGGRILTAQRTASWSLRMSRRE
jgi:hypothetical protein